MAGHTILVVEDEKDIRELLAFTLNREGFAVLEADTGKRALEQAAEKKPDLILLDLMLPEIDGLGVCRMLQRDRATAGIPVIILTAKGEEVDRIVGLELGAADYVVKPCSPREIALRIRAVLRRGTPEEPEAVLRNGSICLDKIGHTVQALGETVDLTITEFRLLEDLMQHSGKARSREQLLNTVWGYAFEGYARTVDTHVRRLRAKLGQESASIETVRGVGYRMKG
jgi:two-component system phosphate regulon response regulator PhoB